MCQCQSVKSTDIVMSSNADDLHKVEATSNTQEQESRLESKKACPALE